MIRHRFIIMAKDDWNAPSNIATSITVDVPHGLTRQEAIDYVTGRVTGEVSRYFASECIGFGPIDPQTDWSAKIT